MSCKHIQCIGTIRPQQAPTTHVRTPVYAQCATRSLPSTEFRRSLGPQPKGYKTRSPWGACVGTLRQ